MVTKLVLAACLCLVQIFLLVNTHAASVSPDIIPSDRIRAGCQIIFKKSIYENSDDPLSNPPYSIDLEWTCDGKTPVIVDRYDVEGSSPEIATVLFRKKQSVIVLVKWSINSQASDLEGNFYKVYVYRFDPENPRHPFTRHNKIMRKLGSGWDGVKEERPVNYPLKDAASIRKALARLGY